MKMNNNITYIIGTIVISLTIIFSVVKLGNLFRPTSTDDQINQINTFHNLPENSIEVITYGSSIMWNGIDVMEMYKNYGIGAYNYGCSWQAFNTTELFFEDSLRTQSPKVVIIDTNKISAILTDTPVDGEIYYTKAISNFDGKEKYLKQCFGDNIGYHLSYHIPFIAFHQNWTGLSQNSFYDAPYNDKYLSKMGYNPLYTETSIGFISYDASRQLELSNESIAILDNIVSKCKHNNINIILISIPRSDLNEYSDALYEYADKNDCVYIDFFKHIDKPGICTNTDFADAGHLNDKGAKKLANYLGQFIINNYTVTDMRTIDNLWEQSLSE